MAIIQPTFWKAAGISFQQVQKFEAGDNRLFEFAKILDVPVSHFFEETAPGIAMGRRKVGRSKRNAGDEAEINLKHETLQLVRAYYNIRNDGVREKIRVMVQALAGKA